MAIKELTAFEMGMLENAARIVTLTAVSNASLRPAMTVLLEEVAEAILAARGKHDDSLELELEQIASVCINLLWQLRCGYGKHVCNIGTDSKYWDSDEEDNNGIS